MVLADGFAQDVADPRERFRVVAYDFGIKRNILRKLVHSGCGTSPLSLPIPQPPRRCS